MNSLNEIVFDIFQKLIKVMHLYKFTVFSKIYDNGCWLKNKPKIVILGSSFAMTSVVPHQISRLNPQYKIDEIANLGQSMGGPYEMYLSLKKHIQILDELEYVYIGIDPHILGEKFFHYMHVEKQFVSIQQWKYLFQNHSKYMKKYHPHIQISMFSPWCFFKSIFTRRCNKNSFFYGYEPRYHSHIKSYKPKDIASYTYEPLELFPVSEFSITHLKKLKVLIETHSKAKIRYMLSPSYDWQDGYSRYCRQYDNQLIELLKANLGEMEILGSLYKEDFELKYYDFYDNRHLSHMGAIKYTSMLFSDIKNEIVAGPIKALDQYRLSIKPSFVLDSFTQNMQILKDQLESYMSGKNAIVLFGFTNLSRCVMSLLDTQLHNSVICDTSSYLGTAPQFLSDSFILEKRMIHLKNLHNDSYDALVICNFVKWDEQYAVLLKNGVCEEKIFRVKKYSLDIGYFHMQVNMFFSLVDYLRSSFRIFYIIGESLALTLLGRLLENVYSVVYFSEKEVLTNTFIDERKISAYIMAENDENIEMYLQYSCNINFENIITIKL